MIDEIKKLIDKIDSYLDAQIKFEELEQTTMSLIANDDFTTLNEQTQDLIYTLDSKELNELSREQIKEIRDSLKDQIEQIN